MKINALAGGDTATLRNATLFRRMRALTRSMRKGTAWRLNVEDIRHGDQCPLTFVGGLKGSGSWAAEKAALRLGLEELTVPIMVAADRPQYFESEMSNPRRHRRLRRILLRAAGLKEAA